jgi:hypothetical protein
VQFQLFYQSTANRVGHDPEPPYHIEYDGAARCYYVHIYTVRGYNSATPYTLRGEFPRWGGWSR